MKDAKLKLDKPEFVTQTIGHFPPPKTEVREWLISLPTPNTDGLILDASFELFPDWDPENTGYIRVIEKSAYLALEAERDKLSKLLTEGNNLVLSRERWIERQIEELEQVKAELKDERVRSISYLEQFERDIRKSEQARQHTATEALFSAFELSAEDLCNECCGPDHAPECKKAREALLKYKGEL